MTDIVERLRDGFEEDELRAGRELMAEAADEIERLRAEHDALRAALVELVAYKDFKDELTRLRSDPYYITQADVLEAQYERRKPAAWDAARATIAAMAPSPTAKANDPSK